jgi:hypothetical protein
VEEEAETLGQSSKEPRKAVGVDLGLARLATLSFGWALLGKPETA